MSDSRDITGFMAQAMAADPVGARAIELAADIEFALAGQIEGDAKVPPITTQTTIETLAKVEQSLGVRIKVVPAEPACPDCGGALNVGWGWCDGCEGWRDL